MFIDINKINRIKDILNIDGKIIYGEFSEFNRNIDTIFVGNSEITKVITRFLTKIKQEIIRELSNGKLVKVDSSIGLFTLFIPSEIEDKYIILYSFFDNHISLESYQEVLAKQGIDIDEKIAETLYSIPVISKKKFNYLLELIANKEEIDYINEVAIFTDESVKHIKKSYSSKKHLVKEILEEEEKFKSEIISAVVQGDITKIMMICDLKNKSCSYFSQNIEENNNRAKMYYMNDILHAALIGSEANILDVNALWINIKNRLDNCDLSTDIVRSYCLLIDKERYKNKQQVVRNCISYINDHIREKINLNDVSDYLGVNKSYLSSIFNKEMDFSIVDYIHNKRISNAKYLLANTDFSISEISDYIGYFDTSYFIRIFKTLENITPLKYRESSHK